MPSPTSRFPMLGRLAGAVSFLLRPNSSLVGRAVQIILQVGIGCALVSILLGAHVLRRHEIQHQMDHAASIITTVESTVRIACFTKDRLLAAEVAQGLLTNESVAGVRIASGPDVLAEIYKGAPAQAETGSWVRREVSSPFNGGHVVGEVEVLAARAVVEERANDYAAWFAIALFSCALLTTVAVARLVFSKVVRPIGALAANLRRVEPRSGGLLPLPAGNESNEIGQLTRAFNALIAELATLLRQEESVRAQLAHRERNFRTLAENSPDYILRYDRECRVVYANPLCHRTFGLAPQGAAEYMPGLYSATPQYAEYREHLAKIVAGGAPGDIELDFPDEAGGVRHIHIRIVVERDGQGGIEGAIAIGRDVTERKRIERELRHQATHDTLTGLPNRLLLKERLTHALARARREKRRIAAIFIDLDNFKDVNDSLGHEAGDRLLKLLAERMGQTLRAGDTVARLGGDEFIVLIEGAADEQDLKTVADKLFASLTAPCELEGRRIYPGASLGIAVYPGDGKDAETLMRNADTAMYVAKAEGRRRCRFFSPDMDAELQAMTDLNNALYQALERREFSLHYQPQVRLEDGRLVGLEALIRWRHPTRGFVSPATFIPLAEKNGLICAIGQWVLQEACRQTRAWLDAGLDPGRVAVNLSAAQCHSGNLALEVQAALTAHKLPGSRLEVEITESLVMSDGEQSLRTLWALREMGVRLAVDDFGTGYSSLSYLKRLPVDVLKIDKSFIDDLETDSDDFRMVQMIVAMAHGLDLEVVAEGVETAGQRDCLQEAGCDLYQGYYFSRPLPPEAIAERLKDDAPPFFPAAAQSKQKETL